MVSWCPQVEFFEASYHVPHTLLRMSLDNRQFFTGFSPVLWQFFTPKQPDSGVILAENTSFLNESSVNLGVTLAENSDFFA